MDVENSSNLYIQTCQIFLTCDYNKPSTFEELYKFLPWLRQSLSCCICSHVLADPMSSTQSHCQHFICKKCQGGKMILKPSCGWCKDQDAFEVNEQLVVLVSCFKKICELIYHSPILFHIKEYDKKSQALPNEAQSKKDSPVKKKKSLKRASRRTDTASSIINISVSQVLEDALHIRESSVSDG